MSNSPSVGLLIGLLCAGATAGAFAANEAPQSLPNFSSLDLPWVAGSGEFLPPQSGIGPVTYDKAHPQMAVTPNARGDAVRAPLRLADLSNPNLKPWVVERLKKANEE